MISGSASNLLLRKRCLFALIVVLGLESGCGVLRRAAIRDVASFLSRPSASNVFVEENDPELVRDALPFVLKGYEALLEVEPKNVELCLSTAEAFVKYANLFVHEEAQRLEDVDFERAQYLRQRGAKLYVRGRDYALTCLAVHHPDFEERLRRVPRQTLGALLPEDVPLLFWAGAGWAGAISADRDNMSLMAELPIVEAMMRRALELDEDFESGIIHEFFIAYEGDRPQASGASPARAKEHFARAVALTEGRKASPFVALAASVAVREQDYKLFEDLLQKALAIDPNAVKEWTLANTLAQEKARWLLDKREALFLNYGGEDR